MVMYHWYVELQAKIVSFSAYATGDIDTELTQNSVLIYFNKSGFMQSAEEYTQDGIHTFKNRKSLYVPKLMNQTQIFLSRLAPKE